MTYRSDSDLSMPGGGGGGTGQSRAPAAAPAPAPQPMGATAVATHPYVAHQQHLTQTNNVPLPGGYQPAHPMQIGKR